MHIHSRLSCLAAVLLLSLSACTSESTGSVQFAASVQQALSASDVTRVKVTVSASDMTSLEVELAQTNGSWSGLISNLPAGTNRSFLAEAFDASGTLRFQGQTSGISIAPNQTTALALTLQQTPPPAPYGNEAPLIDSLTASPTSVQAGASVSLAATVHDPNAGDALTLAWSATGGTFSDTTAATTTWTAPSSVSIHTLTLTVTDSQGAAVSVSLAINVTPGTSTNANLGISFNLLPVVSRVSASPSRLDAGQSTAVSVLVSDADGDALSYQWTASCPGTWTNPTSSAASFVPSSVPANACNNCRLTVTIQDGHGGQTSGAFNLCIAATSIERFPPRFTSFNQSSSSASPGQTVSFDATATDPQATSLTFAWTANTGSLAAPQSTASTSQVVWTAPSCTVTGVPLTVTGVVTNAHGLTASVPFSLTGLPTCAPNQWAAAGAMNPGRNLHTATLLPSGKVLISGGHAGGNQATAAAALYDPASGTWSATGTMTSPRFAHTATLLPNGKVLVAGGFNAGYRATAEVYDPALGTWSATASMASVRGYHAATLLPNGKVLVSGGASPGSLAASEVYDPASGTWSATGSMVSARYSHLATLMRNGKVLVSGGGATNSPFATAEVYDPALGTWSATASMASPRTGHTATPLSGGKVLVVGGYSGSGYLASAALYDPALGTWSATGSMVSPRYLHAATQLLNGKVLVVGSGYGSNPALSAEMYDPALGTWSAAASLTTHRVEHTATLLNNGKVLVAGGINGTTLYAT
ncbi:MAG TPA: kelch repeat-containing protein, partial [Myxococcaceae bacterium]